MTRTVTRIAIAVLAAAALSVGAAPASGEAPSGYGAHHMRRLNLHDSGRSISLFLGHRMKIDLRTAYDGGYSWSRVKQHGPHMFTLQHKDVYPYKHKPGVAGYPYHTVFIMKAVRKGTRTIRFVERQPWKHGAVGDHFKLTVTVH